LYIKNEQSQLNAEYEATQVKNLMTMAHQSSKELSQQLKKISYHSEQRHKTLRDKELKDTDEVAIETKDFKDHLNLLAILQKYKVDADWLKSQQSVHLNELTQRQEMDTEVKAQILEKDFISQQGENFS